MYSISDNTHQKNNNQHDSEAAVYPSQANDKTSAPGDVSTDPSFLDSTRDVPLATWPFPPPRVR